MDQVSPVVAMECTPCVAMKHASPENAIRVVRAAEGGGQAVHDWLDVATGSASENDGFGPYCSLIALNLPPSA